jgi:hypothetical protein
MNSKRVKRSSCTAATSEGEVKEDKDGLCAPNATDKNEKTSRFNPQQFTSNTKSMWYNPSILILS